MALPKISSATYTTKVPSTKTSVKFRPFTVKEQKALLIAQQSEDQTVMIDTLKSVLTACVLDKIDVDTLAIFDLEFMFMQIRAKSVGEIVELLFTCDKCDEKTKLSFDLTRLNVLIPEGHTKTIDLGGNMGIIMKYPAIDVINEISAMNTEDVKSVFNVILTCVDQIYDEKQVYPAKEYTREELNEFMESLSAKQFSKVQEFFETMPRLEQRVEYDCPRCKHHHDLALRGIKNFF